jgi:hypothetical protein
MATFKKGDRVNYVEGGAKDGLGTVTKVIEHKTYEYEVKWDDGEPTDLYFDDQLAADSGLVKA